MEGTGKCQGAFIGPEAVVCRLELCRLLWLTCEDEISLGASWREKICAGGQSQTGLLLISIVVNIVSIVTIPMGNID